jgi:hypothetical protein
MVNVLCAMIVGRKSGYALLCLPIHIFSRRLADFNLRPGRIVPQLSSAVRTVRKEEE